MNLAKKLILYFLYLVLFSLVVVIAVVAYYSIKIPDHRILDSLQPQKISRVYSASYQPIETLGRNNRVYIPIEYIPQKITKSFLATEDKDFYKNIGIDIKGIARAFIKNIYISLGLDEGGMQGGSTITQQIAKNTFLSEDKTFTRKIKEVILAYRLNNSFSKEKILELYLNNTFFGHNTFGIAGASQKYFGKKLEQLSINEIAILAGIPKAPSKFNPQNKSTEVLDRKNVILHLLKNNKIISNQDFLQAIGEEIITSKLIKTTNYNYKYFINYLSKELKNEIGENKIESGGLSIFSSLNEDVQQKATTSFRKNLIQYSKDMGYTGSVGKISDIISWQEELSSNFKHLDKIIFDDTVKIATVLRIDDANKEVILGLKNGDLTVLPFEEFNWISKPYKTKYIIDAFGNKTLPKSSFKESIKIGDVILVQKNTENSFVDYRPIQSPIINGAMIVADVKSGKILSIIGGFNYKQSQFNRLFAKRKIGTLNNSFKIANLSFPDASTLFEVTQIFLSFASSGEVAKLSCINYIQDSDATLLFEKKEIAKNSSIEKVRFERVNKSFEDTLYLENSNNIPYTGISGITQNSFDSWYIGYNANLLVAVYIGYDNPQEIQDQDIINLPKQIFLDFMKDYYFNKTQTI